MLTIVAAASAALLAYVLFTFATTILVGGANLGPMESVFTALLVVLLSVAPCMWYVRRHQRDT